MAEREPTVQPTQFVERLLAAVAFGVALLIAAYGCYFTFLRAPTLRALLQDFGMPLPAPSRMALSWPWIPLVIAVVGLLMGALAWRHPVRWSLVCTYLLAFLALTATIAAELAARWPAEPLFRSVSG